MLSIYQKYCDELSDFGKNPIGAFFFDVSMLFEYFVENSLRAGYVLNSKFENRAGNSYRRYGYKRNWSLMLCSFTGKRLYSM